MKLIFEKLKFPSHRRALTAMIFAALCATHPAAQQTTEQENEPPQRPPFRYLRADEDWGFLRDEARRTDFFDRLKYIPLKKDDENWYLSIGGEFRPRYEFYDNDNWGAGLQDPNGYVQERYMLNADFHFGRRVRVFTHIKGGAEQNRSGDPRAINEDTLDVHQAFFDVGFAGEEPLTEGAESSGVVLRVGRQEISFGGSQRRLLSAAEGRNVRRSFDGASLIVKKNGWRAQGFAAKPVELETGFFNDKPEPGRTFWGVYGVRPVSLLPRSRLAIYYFGLDGKNSRFDQGTGRETRHTVGANLRNRGEDAGKPEGAWDYDWETAYQFGSFRRGRINAWTIATDTGYNIRQAPFEPRIGFQFSVVSGDRDPNDNRLETFNSLYPAGAYFGDIGLIGPYNAVDARPSLELKITENLTVKAEDSFFWRQSTRDGIYGIAANLTRTGQLSRERFIGSQLSFAGTWQINRHWTGTIVYTHFFAGAFLRETPPAEDVNFVRTQLTFRF